ncbi:hypothetical protein BJX64DRAFT_263835 [Aspergillus heterothallicus]
MPPAEGHQSKDFVTGLSCPSAAAPSMAFCLLTSQAVSCLALARLTIPEHSTAQQTYIFLSWEHEIVQSLLIFSYSG